MSKAGKKVGKAMSDAVSGTEAIRTWTDHRIGPQALAEKFKTDMKQGLSSTFAKEESLKVGENALTKKDVVPWYVMFLKEMIGFFSLLLWFGSALCFIGFIIQADKEDKANLYLGIVLAAVTFLTGCFSYAQTSKSAEMMAQFENFIPPRATVLRDGEVKTIDAKELVPGDIVVVKGGENVPCDICIFQANEMKVNNASLTGESEDIFIDPDLEPVVNIFETKNVAFFGTSCTAGEGRGICFRIGDGTVIGQIANLASSAESAETPLSIEIHRFILIISAVAMSLGVIFFIFGIAYDYDIITNLVFAIGIIVANVPEGLLATVTVSLALTAQRMAGKMVLVKNLESVETLGSTSCICSDKTGTLTQNRMTVSHMFFNRKTVDCSINYQAWQRNNDLPKEKKDDKMEIEYSLQDPGFMALVEAVVLGTYTVFSYEPSDDEAKQLYARMQKVAVASLEHTTLDSAVATEMKARLRSAESKLLNIHRKCKGDASETGLVQFAESVMSLTATRDRAQTHKFRNDAGKETEVIIPFNSEFKFNLFVRDLGNEKGGLTVFMKGAPERILTRCDQILLNGEEIAFTDELRSEIDEANKTFGRLGERVLAFARYTLDASKYTREYQFDVKTWKTWGLDMNTKKSAYENTPGAFPMHGLTLVGIVSLNDPPRLKVDLSVLKCRSAGIKVIMVTGDQPPTAAAIAHKVNILKHPAREFNHMRDALGMSEDEAWQQSTGVVVHGDTLAAKHKEQEGLDDDDETKGDFLQDWISKFEVVFARTTPSQKLLIVDACQKAGHVVAVTGDGVNDSPAIKKADIGIAMGSGSDVAKNAADMLLLDDNFSSIVNGVEEGRLIFDNLKKSIAYTLSSNIPEILPFIFFILFQVPLPLSTVLILCIDLGTDMVPAISFAYENPELDIMDRVPRNAKRDHLVNTKLISFAYFQIGVIQASAGMYTYFLILNDFGVRPTGIWQMSELVLPGPGPIDTYLLKGPGPVTSTATSPYWDWNGGVGGKCSAKGNTLTQKDCPWNPLQNKSMTSLYGNTSIFCPDDSKDEKTIWEYSGANPGKCPFTPRKLTAKDPEKKVVDYIWYKMAWDKVRNSRVDLRLFYAPVRAPTTWTQCRYPPVDASVAGSPPSFFMYSHISEYAPICYSSESLKMAQSGYLVSIVCVQWADLMICKTRNLSLSQQGMINHFGNFGLFFETALVAILLYVPFLNVALGTRPIPFAHFAVPSFSFFVAIFFYDELRKIWLRNGMTRENGQLKLTGWIVQNTYY